MGGGHERISVEDVGECGRVEGQTLTQLGFGSMRGDRALLEGIGSQEQSRGYV